MAYDCSNLYCSAQCCNYYGTCPNYASSSVQYNTCWTYYDSYYAYYALSWWIWTLIGVGIFIFVVTVICCVVCCCRACRKPTTQTVILDNTSPSINTGYAYHTNPNYNYNYNPNQNYDYSNQIYMGQAVKMDMQMKGF